MSRLDQLVVSPDNCLRDVLACIDQGAQGIALVLDPERRLLATITDGDLRRAILAGTDLALSVRDFIRNRDGATSRTPRTAKQGTSDSELLHLMTSSSLRQIPLVDDDGRVVSIALLNELVKEYELPLRAVVMAGGFGTRLRPLTDDLPKPMLPVGDRPLLELIVEQLRGAGIRRVNVTTHYKGELIADHFKDGQDFGVEIRYLNEDRPLGTAGALSLLEDSDEPLLVMNGDILTRVDFRAMHDFHREHTADLTVAVREYEFSVPYGVIETDGVMVTGISEKPSLRQFINAGIYLLNPSVIQTIPNGERFDVPDLINRLVSEGRRVVCFPIREYWLDIGKADHYNQAVADVQTGRY